MNTQIIKLETKNTDFFKFNFSSLIFQVSLCFLMGLILFLITLLKTHSASYFFKSPVVYIYTLFVTLFRLSRLSGTIFYPSVDKKIKEIKQYEVYEPPVTFVVPCKNEEDAIYKTITKCFESNYPSNKVEVIVVNDGSTDGTINILKKAKKEFNNLVVVDWKINQGKRHAMAEGFKMAKGEIIIQLDSDSYIEPSTLPRLVEYFNNPSVGAVCAHAYIENSDQNLLTRMQAAHYYIAFRISKAAESSFASVFCCSGCSSAYRKSIVLPIIDKWLGETFLGLPITWGDDRGLTNWVIKLGYKTIYTDKAKAYTIAPAKWKQFIKQQIRWKKGWLVNSIIAGKFIWKKEPFVAFSYFFPLTITTLISPFIALKVFFWDMFVNGIYPFYFIAGSLLLNCIIVLYYRILSPKDKYWFYTFIWTFLNMFFLSYILFYAVATIQNRKWGTR